MSKIWHQLKGSENRKKLFMRKTGTLSRRLGRYGFEAGQSLPAALIALAVGSLLLTPFLAFVSSRSLGTGTAQETFNELYAADGGVEYGIWSLLNTPAFRSQVDLTAGTAQPLAFPGSLNGFTPTLSVTGLPIGNWYLRQTAPLTIESGGSLAYAGGDRIYALRGNRTTNFGYYSISGDQWFSLASTPNIVDQGGSLVYGGGNFLYALQGNNLDGFWRYNISNNTWQILAPALERINQGGSLVYPGGNFIYAMGNKNIFWRYNISSNSWSSLANTPDIVANGAALVFTGGNTIYAFEGNSTAFWRYNIASDSWTVMQSTLGKVTKGSALAYFGGGYLYALQGNSTGFLRYNIAMGNWIFLTETPLAVGNGGSLVFTHSEGGYAFRGGNNTDFWEFEVTPPRYDISVQAGTVSTDARIEIDGGTKTILFWDID
ncbi:MAG: hypothetical protein E4H33_02430 [Anaerolineales bacterium]|nr:MAG: hypothetical protein E4H33_02430 [Anaerolineales bacterium]